MHTSSLRYYRTLKKLFYPYNEVEVGAYGFMRVFLSLKVTGYLKTFIKTMVSLKFKCSLISKDFIEIEAQNQRIEIIIINHDDDGLEYESCGVSLDKQTAIKLSKELRKQIALLD